MATTLQPLPAGVRTRPPREKREPLLLRGLLFLLGMTLPMISFSMTRDLSSQLSDRVAVVDVLCLLTFAGLVASRRLQLRWSHFVYALALAVAFALGMAAEPKLGTITAMAALVMAALYIVVGESVGNSPGLVRALLAGIVVGALGESVVVFHDYFFSQWFPDRTSNRVRGTFKASGQLAQYGFAVVGILLTFGWAFFHRNSARLMVVLAGGAGAFFVIAASRRSGIVALGIWIALYLLFGLRNVSRRAYLAMFACALVGLALVAIFFEPISESYFSQRLTAAFQSINKGDSFTQQQAESVVDNIEDWFPLGAGVGQGHVAAAHDPLMPVGEIHNGHLAIAVELGLFGLLAFYFLCLRTTLARFDGELTPHSPTIRPLLIAFVLAAMAFMLHNRLHRDRAFGLFLGLAPGIAAATALRDPARRRASGRQTAPPALLQIVPQAISPQPSHD